jgi:hypothetical protein
VSVKDQFMQIADSHNRTVENIREQSQRVRLPDDVPAWLGEVEAECATLWAKLPQELEPEYRQGMGSHIARARELLSGENPDDLKFYVYLIFENFRRMSADVRLYRNDIKTAGAETGANKSREARVKHKQYMMEEVRKMYVKGDSAGAKSVANIAKALHLTTPTVRTYLDELGLKTKKRKVSK